MAALVASVLAFAAAAGLPQAAADASPGTAACGAPPYVTLSIHTEAEAQNEQTQALADRLTAAINDDNAILPNAQLYVNVQTKAVETTIPELLSPSSPNSSVSIVPSASFYGVAPERAAVVYHQSNLMSRDALGQTAANVVYSVPYSTWKHVFEVLKLWGWPRFGIITGMTSEMQQEAADLAHQAADCGFEHTTSVLLPRGSDIEVWEEYKDFLEALHVQDDLDALFESTRIIVAIVDTEDIIPLLVGSYQETLFRSGAGGQQWLFVHDVSWDKVQTRLMQLQGGPGDKGGLLSRWLHGSLNLLGGLYTAAASDSQGAGAAGSGELFAVDVLAPWVSSPGPLLDFTRAVNLYNAMMASVMGLHELLRGPDACLVGDASLSSSQPPSEAPRIIASYIRNATFGYAGLNYNGIPFLSNVSSEVATPRNLLLVETLPVELSMQETTLGAQNAESLRKGAVLQFAIEGTVCDLDHPSRFSIDGVCSVPNGIELRAIQHLAAVMDISDDLSRSCAIEASASGCDVDSSRTPSAFQQVDVAVWPEGIASPPGTNTSACDALEAAVGGDDVEVPVVLIIIAASFGVVLFVVTCIVIPARTHHKQYREWADFLHAQAARRLDVQRGKGIDAELQQAAQSLFGDIVIQAYLGRGSFGTVYMCIWQGREVAAKIVRVNGPASLQAVVHEALLSTRLRHPNLVCTWTHSIRDSSYLPTPAAPNTAQGSSSAHGYQVPRTQHKLNKSSSQHHNHPPSTATHTQHSRITNGSSRSSGGPFAPLGASAREHSAHAIAEGNDGGRDHTDSAAIAVPDCTALASQTLENECTGADTDSALTVQRAYQPHDGGSLLDLAMDSGQTTAAERPIPRRPSDRRVRLAVDSSQCDIGGSESTVALQGSAPRETQPTDSLLKVASDVSSLNMSPQDHGWASIQDAANAAMRTSVFHNAGPDDRFPVRRSAADCSIASDDSVRLAIAQGAISNQTDVAIGYRAASPTHSPSQKSSVRETLFELAVSAANRAAAEEQAAEADAAADADGDAAPGDNHHRVSLLSSSMLDSPQHTQAGGLLSLAEEVPDSSERVEVEGEEDVAAREAPIALTPSQDVSHSSGGAGALLEMAAGLGDRMQMECWIIMEYCNAGTLATCVQRGMLHDAGIPKIREILILAAQVAHGLLYLHDEGVYHGDLKTGNIMMHLPAATPKEAQPGDAAERPAFVAWDRSTYIRSPAAVPHEDISQSHSRECDDEAHSCSTQFTASERRRKSTVPEGDSEEPFLLQAKLADFGLSRMLGVSTHVQTQNVGTVTHMPPETLTQGRLSQKADVYSFGMVLWELFTGQEPYKDMMLGQIVAMVVVNQERLPFPRWCPYRYKQLALQCLESDPDKRPTMLNVLQQLGDMLKDKKAMQVMVRSTYYQGAMMTSSEAVGLGNDTGRAGAAEDAVQARRLTAS